MHAALLPTGVSTSLRDICCMHHSCCVHASGVLDCTRESRISQLRIAALDALLSILTAATNDGDLAIADDIQNPSRNAVEDLLKDEKNAIVLGKAQKLHSLLKF